jgi:hypothetical protein
MRWAAAFAAASAALGLARLLPESGVGLWLRLGAATVLLLLPGAAIARALRSPGVGAALSWTLAALFVGMAASFALGSSLRLALLVLAAAGIAALPLALRAVPARPAPGVRIALAAGTALGIALWHVARPTVEGDALFHLARVRKLEDFGSLSLESVGEFRDGGLHPGYAFPLWHGFLGLVSQLAGVDPALVVRHESSLLAPVAAAVAYEAGWAVFRSRGAAAAVLLAQVALIALAPGHGGAYRVLALPATAGRQLLVLAALALVVEALRSPTLGPAATAGAAMLAVAVVHPTYALFLLAPLAGYLVVRLLLGPAREPAAHALVGAAVVLPTAAFVAWLLPVVRDTASHDPSRAVLAGDRHGVGQYPGQVELLADGRIRLEPEVLARGGSVAVAGLALVPLAFFASRRRWGQLVLGGSLAVLALVLVAALFTPLVDAVSLSQARRIAGFVPFAFAFAGGLAVLAGALRALVLPVALVAGIVVQLAFPGDFGYRLDEGGPALAVWIAVVGGLLALAAALVLRRDAPPARGGLVGAAAALFVLPVAIHAAANWGPVGTPAGKRLSAGLGEALRREVPEREVVFSDLETSYRIAAFAPVYVAASPPAHVADTSENRPYQRARDVRRFLRTGSLAIPRRYGAGWLVVDRRHYDVPAGLSPPVHRDGRYSLYRL